ncbi:MAG: lmo0937 family membrane protein [Candidatus Pacebacteria bacterium]|nr:lmo0937 family membrane protein [Candidatus Paceibacterota bacterium]
MLSTIAIVLVALWLLGVATSYTIGGFIHVLFVIAIIMVLIRLIKGEKIV